MLTRYDLRTDHGVYPTVVEELLRAFYLADVGGAEWNAMKKETADTFEAVATAEDGSSSTPLPQACLRGASELRWLATPQARCSSTTSSPTCSAGMQPARVPCRGTTKLQVVFLAPAATTAAFADALGKRPDWLGRARIGRFRMFTMTDAAEQADRLVGAIYPRSLLFLVSGLLERDAKSKSALLPLVGLSRYLDEGREKLLESDRVSPRGSRTCVSTSAHRVTSYCPRRATTPRSVPARARRATATSTTTRWCRRSLVELIRSW